MKLGSIRRFRIRKWLLSLLGLLATLLLLGVLWMVIFEWRPELLQDTPIERGAQSSSASMDQGQAGADHLALLSWNIGYAVLDASADFFMDGGSRVRAPNPQAVRDNLTTITSFLQKQQADLLLLQEVDQNSSRSFDIDEARWLAEALPVYDHSFAFNYRARWVPYPVFHPLGRVESGLFSLSRLGWTSAKRHQLPGSFPWPVRVFHLKRCVHELRLPAADGKDWVILHLHLSTFDRDGRLRRQEMVYLKQLLLQMSSEGHHLIVGGDWNQAFPGIGERAFPAAAQVPDWFQRAPEDWAPPGFAWAFDPSVPSLRATDRPYLPGKNFLTIVDGFLVGPDVEVRSVRTVDLEFQSSDHQPVLMEVGLRAMGQ